MTLTKQHLQKNRKKNSKKAKFYQNCNVENERQKKKFQAFSQLSDLGL